MLADTDYLVLNELYSDTDAAFFALPVMASIPAVAQGRYHVSQGPSETIRALDRFSPIATDVAPAEIRAIGQKVAGIAR